MKKKSSKLKQIKLLVASFFIFFVVVSQNFCEELLHEEFGYAVDLPEDFFIKDATEDGLSFLAVHKDLPINFVSRIYENSLDSKISLQTALSKLRATYEQIDNFIWTNLNCAITEFVMVDGNSGWALCVPLLEKKSCLVLLSYAPSQTHEGTLPFIISSINSLTINSIETKKENFFEAGPITTYAFPKKQNVEIELEIKDENGKLQKIKTQIDSDDKEAAKFLIDCEYKVMTYYALSAKWQEAWKRYYRQIFRDSVSRTKKIANDIFQAFSEKEKSEIVKILLSWVQSFEYVRGEFNSSDFTSIPSCVLGEGSDCDARSVLLCALCKNIGIDSVLFVSRKYSHAIFGVALEGKGAKIKVGKKDYLLGETTAKVELGLIAEEMSDAKRWLAVTFD